MKSLMESTCGRLRLDGFVGEVRLAGFVDVSVDEETLSAAREAAMDAKKIAPAHNIQRENFIFAPPASLKRRASRGSL
jgi:hypothetical protein